mmetsp:Transcript_22294/g.53470  ORF Transcript_22294/g.53470 Transcript_22294/m.53470 type:complete len:264 (-) Transcript_22294:4-795(-)
MHVRVLCAEVPPLEPVHWSQVPLLPVPETHFREELLGAVAVPDVDVLVPEEVGVGRAGDEPEELLGDAAPEDALGRQQRERLPQIEPQRAPELRDGAGARAVAFPHARRHDVADQVQVLVLLVLLVAAARRGGAGESLDLVLDLLLLLDCVRLGGGVEGEVCGEGGRDEGVTLEHPVHQCAVHLAEPRHLQRLRVHGGAPNYEAARHVRARVEGGERGGEGRRGEHALGQLEGGGGAGEDNVDAAGERAELGGDRVPRLSPHD